MTDLVFVYWNRGSCMYGDHAAGLAEFPDTPEGRAAARRFARDQLAADSDCAVTVVRGRALDPDEFLKELTP